MFTQTAQAIAGVGQVLTGQQKPTFKINAPVLFNNGATNVSTNVVRAHAPACTAQALRYLAVWCTALLRPAPGSGPPCLVELPA